MQKKNIRQKFDNLSRWNTQQATNNKPYQHQHNKCHYEKSTAMGKEWKLFLWGQEEGKDTHSALQFNKTLKPLDTVLQTYDTQNSTNSPYEITEQS